MTLPVSNAVPEVAPMPEVGPTAGRAAFVPHGGAPDARALQAYRRDRSELAGVAVRLSGVDAGAASPPVGWVHELQAEENRIARRLGSLAAQRNLPDMLVQAVKLSNVAVRSDLAAKVIGKSVAAVDRLTQLS